MKTYLSLLRQVMDEGVFRGDRTGTGTWSIFGAQARFRMDSSFPLLTTKKLHLRSIIHELLWFLKGETNIDYLRQNKVSIWDEWADENGDLGRVYGAQWTDWRKPDGGSVNQINEVIGPSARTPRAGGTWSAPGIRGSFISWLCPLATPSFSSTSRRADSVANSTRGAQIFSSEFPSI